MKQALAGPGQGLFEVAVQFRQFALAAHKDAFLYGLYLLLEPYPSTVSSSQWLYRLIPLS
jgi:hypothetical protein